MMYAMRWCFGIFFLLLVVPAVTQAADFTVRPLLLDLTLEPRESRERQITLTNGHENRKLVVYATVNTITVDDAGEIKEFVSPSMVDRSTSITSWIELTRGRIEIPPGASTTVPVTVHPNFNAAPGAYHAFLGFVPASKRPQAEARARAGTADGVILKVTVPDQRTEGMRINRFAVERFVTGADSRTIDLEIENVGDLPSAPTGEIIFYDSRGAEVDAVTVNTEQTVIPPGETRILQAEIPVDDQLGRFKANVSLAYGANQRANLTDTNFFYLMPSYLLLALVGGFLIVLLLVALLFRRVYADEAEELDGEAVPMFVKQGHEPKPKDHDIDLSQRDN